MTLQGKTLFITGGSRGIGLAIALRAARDGARIVIAAKTATEHAHLPGTVYSAAEQIVAAGGEALPLIVDVRDEENVREAVRAAAEAFGGIDICINNAGAISLTNTADTPMKRFDLMHQVNVRATFMVSQACLPYLEKSANPHILNLAPPINLDPRWLGGHIAYTLSKYGMSLCTLGMAEEFRERGIACNGLWPISTIDTAATRFAVGDGALQASSRTPEIMADAAYRIITSDSRQFTGRLMLDEQVLREGGCTDFEGYSVVPGASLHPDMFVDERDLAAVETHFLDSYRM